MKTYTRPMAGWWRRNPYYGWYKLREASSVFIGYASEPVGLSDRVAFWPTLTTQHSNIDLVLRADIERLADAR